MSFNLHLMSDKVMFTADAEDSALAVQRRSCCTRTMTPGENDEEETSALEYCSGINEKPRHCQQTLARRTRLEENGTP